MDPANNNFELTADTQQPTRRPRRRTRGPHKRRYSRGPLTGGRGTHQQQPSFSSNNTSDLANNNFFHTSPPYLQAPPTLLARPLEGYMPSTQPSHAPTSVWKSNELKERDEWQRTVKKIRYIAPNLVQAGLFPRNTNEWRQFKLGRIQDQLKAKERDASEIAARIEASGNIPSQGRTIKSAFSPEGKIFKTGGGPVLAMPTIWSNEYFNHNTSVADWPTQAELLMHGDNKDMANRHYRSFPPPRAPAEVSNQSYQEQQILVPQWMDEVEPEFTQGPRYIDYVHENVRSLDENPVFNGEGNGHLGGSLIDIIGHKEYRIFGKEEDKIQEKESKHSSRQSHGRRRDRKESNMNLGVASPTFVPAGGFRLMREHRSTIRPSGSGICTEKPFQVQGGDRLNTHAGSEHAAGHHGDASGYGHQMYDGSIGYPQQDGSWSFVPGRKP